MRYAETFCTAGQATNDSMVHAHCLYVCRYLRIEKLTQIM
jgi:hypothetical protein